jgi:hypothetical protein
VDAGFHVFGLSARWLVPTSLKRRRALAALPALDNMQATVPTPLQTKVPLARGVKREAGATPALCPQL